MGVLYSIVPIDKQVADYLHEIGVSVPDWKNISRNPTPQELRMICGRMTDVKVDFLASPNHAWQIMFEGLNNPEHEPWTLLNVRKFNGDETVPHEIWFEKGWPSLIVHIVHDLTAVCGSLVIFPDTGCRPLVVKADDDAQQLFATWEHASGLPWR